MTEFDPGSVQEPFATPAADYPGVEIYPPADFRVEGGRFFTAAGSTARLACWCWARTRVSTSRSPDASWSARRGQRVQGFLRKLGIERSYVMMNAFLYSVASQGRGERHRSDPPIVAYRHHWLDAVLTGGQVETVVAFGRLARDAFEGWPETDPGQSIAGAFEPLPHPTMPTAASEKDRSARPI